MNCLDMQCSGTDAMTGSPVEIEFDGTIRRVTTAQLAGDYIAPGWIDIQVNGFAGVDYSQPDAPHSEIARSIHALFATGVTRFYPTVITGAAQPGAGQGFAAGRRCHGGLPRRGTTHRHRRWPARRTSQALGAQAGFR